MLLIPRRTEKVYNEIAKNTYVFYIPETSSKQAIADAIKAQFGVTAVSVRVVTRKGKATRFSKGKHAYPGKTFRRDKKIAYVTLKDGESIAIFNTNEAEANTAEAKKAEAKTADAKKKATKKEDK